jgi:uncharacterized membrane protein
MAEAIHLFRFNIHWFMGLNVILAMIPCALSFMLFTKRSPKRLPVNPIWWFGLVTFILFLPNAPYVITDIIHFVDNVRSSNVSANGIIFILIPQYVVFLLFGFQCYVLSLMNLIQYLGWLRLVKNAIWLEITMNFICAIGVYWGRVNRLNSWDVVTQPFQVVRDVLRNFTNPNFYIATIVFFIIFTILYYVFKWINTAIIFYWQNHSKQVTA